MRIYDSGGFAFEDATFGADIGFTIGDLFAGEEAGRDTDILSESVHFFKFAHLLRVLRNDPFLGVAMWNSMSTAIVV